MNLLKSASFFVLASSMFSCSNLADPNLVNPSTTATAKSQSVKITKDSEDSTLKIRVKIPDNLKKKESEFGTKSVSNQESDLSKDVSLEGLDLFVSNENGTIPIASSTENFSNDDFYLSVSDLVVGKKYDILIKLRYTYKGVKKVLENKKTVEILKNDTNKLDFLFSIETEKLIYEETSDTIINTVIEIKEKIIKQPSKPITIETVKKVSDNKIPILGVYASSVSSEANRESKLAYDGNNKTYWGSGTFSSPNTCITLKTAPVIFKEIKILAAGLPEGLVTVDISVSNDNFNFTKIKSDITFQSIFDDNNSKLNDSFKSILLDNQSTFQYIKVTCKNWAGSWVAIREIELYK